MTHNNSPVIDQQNLLTRYNQPRQLGRFNRLSRSRIKDQALFPDILLWGQIAHRRWPGPSLISTQSLFHSPKKLLPQFPLLPMMFRGCKEIKEDVWVSGVIYSLGRRWRNRVETRWSADWGAFDKLWWSYANEGCGRISGLHDSISSSQTNTLTGWAMNLYAGIHTGSIISMIMKLK